MEYVKPISAYIPVLDHRGNNKYLPLFYPKSLLLDIMHTVSAGDNVNLVKFVSVCKAGEIFLYKASYHIKRVLFKLGKRVVKLSVDANSLWKYHLNLLYDFTHYFVFFYIYFTTFFS